jgi:beta-glucosidase-like glycosyl hydrolase
LSDDLEMGGAAGREMGPAAVQAILAGHDLALVCRRRQNIELAAAALGRALFDGTIEQRRLADSRRRVRAALGLPRGGGK